MNRTVYNLSVECMFLMWMPMKLLYDGADHLCSSNIWPFNLRFKITKDSSRWKKFRTLRFFHIHKSQVNVKDFQQFPLTAIRYKYYTCTGEVITSRQAANSLIEFTHSSYPHSPGLSFTIFAHWPILMQNFPNFSGIFPVSPHFNISVEASSTSKRTKTRTAQERSIFIKVRHDHYLQILLSSLVNH